MDDGRIYAVPSSDAHGFASGLAWLWRLGPVLPDPDARAIGVGTLDEAVELHALVRAGRLLGALVFAPEAGVPRPPVPLRRAVSGLARFPSGSRIRGQFTVLDEGEPLVRSSLGVHAAVLEPRTLVLGADASRGWTLLAQYWLLEAVATFLTRLLDRPLVLLPPVGCVRLDDAPGTAEHQARGTDHSDQRQTRRIRALAREYARRGARLNTAVAVRAFGTDGRTAVPLEDRWPEAVAAIAAGVKAGTFEPVGHGYLHLDAELLDQGVIEPREFARLGPEEAGRRIDEIVTWQDEVLGRSPSTFVAPAWGYSGGALDALAARGLPAWQRPQPGPLRARNGVHETVDSAFRGLDGLDYGPLATAARYGLPPTPVFHGGLFDLRPQQLRDSFDVLTAARLVARRDLLRLPSLAGVRWIGAGSFVQLLDEHESVHVRGAEVDSADAPEALLMGPGATLQRARDASRS